MNKNMRVSTLARHVYTQAYAEYLQSGNLEAATREVAQQISANRGTKPGTPQQDWEEAERITGQWPRTITEQSQYHLFDKALDKTRHWLKDVETELGLRTPDEAWRAMRAVLHAVRDQLSPKECVEFASQLPVLIAGMYYSGWTPSRKPVKARGIEEFMGSVSAQLPKGMDPQRVTRGVITVLEKHISPGEIEDVRLNFPEPLRELWGEVPQSRR
jgi:uncharacterized protein (DUF2267 family)